MRKMSEFVKNEYMNENGEAVIHINIPEDYAFFEPLSLGKSKDLNPEIYDYIDRRANLIPSTVPLMICFHGRSFDKEEQNHIRAMMQEHYEEEYYDLKWDKASQARRITGLLILAGIMLALYIYMNTASDHPMFEELFSMIGTVAGWEAIDILLLDRPDTNLHVLSVRQNLNQTVEFENS